MSAATIPCGARGAKMDPLGVLGVDWRLPSEGGVEGFPRVLIEIEFMRATCARASAFKNSKPSNKADTIGTPAQTVGRAGS